LGIIDLLGLALLGVHVASDWLNDGIEWTVPLRAYGEWAVPYLAGRLAIQRIDDARGLLPVVLVVSLILGILSAVETLTGVNLHELAFGDRPVDQFPRDASRLGWKRAFGPTMHPIYFGTLQVLLFGWTLYAASRARRRRGPRWWRATPWIAAAGVFFTISRAPLLAIGVILYGTAFLTAPRFRSILTAVLVVAAIGAIAARQPLLDAIHLWGGDRPIVKKTARTITIGDEERPVSSVMTRVYFFEVYGLAMRRAGWLGFGTERTTGFPPRVPIGPQHAETLEQVWTVDNAYILLVLRFGYAGCTVFSAFLAAALCKLAWRGGQPLVPGQSYLASAAAALFAGLLLLSTVWMPHDFGFWLLWSIGAASGLDFSTPSDWE
jgi:hypothetical protein